MGAGAVAVILLTGSPASFEDGPVGAPPRPPAELPSFLRPVPKVEPLAGAPNREGPAPPTEFEPPPPRPEPGSWAAAPLAPRAVALGPFGATVSEYLGELQDRIATCFDEETEARFGQVRISRTREGGPGAPEGPTLLVLHLELRPGEVLIVDAPVEVQGEASDGLIACAQQILRGRVIQAPGIRGSVGRARLAFPLVP